MARTVLVVEDDELTLRAYTDLLKAYNFAAIESRDVAEALTRIKGGVPDAVLLDMRLHSSSGLMLARTIREDLKLHRLPIVGISGNATPADRDACLAAGCTAFLSKPIDVGEMIETLERCISQPGRGS